MHMSVYTVCYDSHTLSMHVQGHDSKRSSNVIANTTIPENEIARARVLYTFEVSPDYKCTYRCIVYE